ncbi:SDR family oxidoreductase [Piscinibacter sakaiensis]|uniref:SDR family oxidoreductase n=1 Tax=Piscinibacter sakaiensis TaxID=1547922 RepID=UPI003AAAE2C8
MTTLAERFRFDGQTVLITGGSRGLGLQMAEGFGEMGARVVLSARGADELAQAKAMLASRGVDAEIVPGSLAEEAFVPELVSAACAATGRIDVLVNNAGAAWGGAAESLPRKGWDKVMDLNLHALFRLTQAVARELMIPRRHGKIINIASIAGMRSILPHPERPSTVAYDTSKAAVIALTRALATEWGRFNINVNAIAPGPFPSQMNSLSGAWEAQLRAAVPLGRFGGAEDLKGAAVFLASEAASFVHGHTLVVDGGRTCC